MIAKPIIIGWTLWVGYAWERCMKRKRLCAILAAALLSACASPSPTYTAAGSSSYGQQIDEYAMMLAPAAARAAGCGHWDLAYWQSNLIRAEVRLGRDTDLSQRFAKSFEAALANTTDAWGTMPCSVAYDQAVQGLVNLETWTD